MAKQTRASARPRPKQRPAYRKPARMPTLPPPDDTIMRLHRAVLEELGVVEAMPDYSWLAETNLDFAHIGDDLKAQALLGVPYTAEMIANAAADVVTQSTNDNADAVEMAKRYPKLNARDFDGNPSRITEADALIAYLQMLGTQVDFKLYDDKANIR